MKKKNYYAPSPSSIRLFNSEKQRFLREYPNAKVTRKGGDVRVNGIYACYIGSAIGQASTDIFNALKNNLTF